MHGGYAPTPRRPSRGAQIGLRVLFVAIAVLSLGFLTFAAVLRLALTTHRKVDWTVFGAVAALQTGAFVLMGTDPGGDEFTTWRGNAGIIVQLLVLAAAVTYYLVADVRHCGQRRLAYAAAPAFPPPQAPPAGYGHPQPYAASAPVHSLPTQTAPAPAPVPAPQPQAQAPRIHQVQAELDELSDYLRRREGGR